MGRGVREGGCTYPAKNWPKCPQGVGEGGGGGRGGGKGVSNIAPSYQEGGSFPAAVIS